MIPSVFSFIDVETTGSSPVYNRVLEVGIVRVENDVIVDSLDTVLNPNQHIDPFITQLTGISESDIVSAPQFGDIAQKLQELLKDSVFVAHNVRFDYAFLRNEFRRAGYAFTARQLCTVKLSRALYPNYRRHNLDSIITRFGLPCEARHRAMGDARVLWEFYQKSRLLCGDEVVADAISQIMRRPTLPSGLTAEMLDELPDGPGVYIMYGEGDAILYIGKSIHVRERVLSHFQEDLTSGKEMRLSQTVRRIEVRETSGEFSALLLESQLVKQYQPLYNRQLRHAYDLIFLTETQDEKGYLRPARTSPQDLSIEEERRIIGVFRSRRQMQEALSNLAKEYRLCPILLGLEHGTGPCFSYHLGNCDGACIGKELAIRYNMRSVEAFSKHRVRAWPFDGPVVIRENDGEGFVVDKWRIVRTIHSSGVFEHILENTFDLDTYKILSSYVLTPKAKKLSIRPYREEVESI